MSTSKRPKLIELKWQNKNLLQLKSQLNLEMEYWWQALENAYHSYPDKEFQDLCDRLERDTGSSMGAIWELFLWQLLNGTNCNVRLKQPIPNTGKNADFYIQTAQGFVAYIEATTSSSGPELEDRKRFYGELFELIRQQINVPFTLLYVNTREESLTLPNTVIVCQQISDWVELKRHLVTADNPFSLKLKTNGWTFDLSLQVHESALGEIICARKPGPIDDVEHTRIGMTYKVNKLKSDPEAPYIIAIAPSSKLDFSTVAGRFRALYGDLEITFDTATSATSVSLTNIWDQHNKEKFTNFVSGVLFGSGAIPGFRSAQPLELWIFSRVAHPIDPGLIPFDCLVYRNTHTGLIKTKSGPGNTWIPANNFETP